MSDEQVRLIAMLPTYETKRLILRERAWKDLEDCLQMDMNPEVVKYIRPTPPEEEHRAFLQESFSKTFADQLGFWSILEKTEEGGEGRYLGWMVLAPLDKVGPENEIGYRFIQDAWGKGYATEGALVIRDHGFERAGLNEICAVTDPNNQASQNVLRKIGLKRCGNRFAFGLDLPYFLLTKQDWESLKAPN